ncbi:hypothetical protein A9Q84_06365 [Halobacteriovorax marinus]|uniref:FAD-binding domain-containing protein n=1 Tax=Halobacteriovorax marinus TaxID=97084 RepID=A0A1Y5F9F8_9BACT|nr:hypothetical protein A9Q84_06365 [Halobacteriovorax marinus]
MSKKVQFVLDFEGDVEEYLQKKYQKMVDFRILSQALDARGSNRGKRPRYNYNIEIVEAGEKFSGVVEQFHELGAFKQTPIIIGAGPGGLFCALRLAEYGIPSIVIERGERAHKRMKFIARFWRYGEFNTENNVCYGEGGAGLFSDGKLITRIKSPYVQYVMNRLVDFGAPKDTAYVTNPHLGSNKIRGLINKISDFLVSRGSQILYNTRVDELIYKDDQVVGVRLDNGKELFSNNIVLATGHSAKEVYKHLEENKVSMSPKDFAVGVRIEHPRELIDKMQYGDFAKSHLGAARYRLSFENKKTDKGTYSFCMCPGGYVLSSGTEADGIVVNGMSNYARNSRWSNSALVVSVKANQDFSTENVLGGLDFQHGIEKKAFEVSSELASGKELPSQTLKDFLDGSVGKSTMPKTSTPSGIVEAQISEILPDFVTNHLRDALTQFDQRMNGFVSKNALLLAPETRTSAPVTISRDKVTLESTTHRGLFPCGEGAGHAGGITSAAVDGVRIAMSMIQTEKGHETL